MIFSLRESRARSAWLRASLQPATLFGGMLIVACWIGLTLVLSIERTKTLENATQKSAALARLFEDYIVRALQGIDQTLLLLREAYEKDPEHFDLPRLTEQAHITHGLTFQVALLGPDGLVRATTVGDVTQPLYFGDREHFQAQATAKTDELFISKPVVGRASGKLSIQLTRRLRLPDGGFGGVILASLDPAFVDKFAQTVDIGPHGTVTVRGTDGIIRASSGYAAPAIGRYVMQDALKAALAHAPVGHFWGGGAVDGMNRLVGYQLLNEFRQIVSVGLADVDIFADYERDRTVYTLVAAAITLLVVPSPFSSSTRKLIRLAFGAMP